MLILQPKYITSSENFYNIICLYLLHGNSAKFQSDYFDDFREICNSYSINGLSCFFLICKQFPNFFSFTDMCLYIRVNSRLIHAMN